MGRIFEGGLGKHTLLPTIEVRKLDVALPWVAHGALLEMVQTAQGL